MLRDFVKSVASGIMIGIGGSVYLNAEYKFVGAAFFCVGLMSILLFGMNLYTGKVGYISSLRDALYCILYIIGNAVGCAVVALIPVQTAAAVAEAKLIIPLPTLFLKALLCGVLMYIAVDVYKTRGQLLATFFCIPAFILGGFEHSIADIYYFFAARAFSVRMVIVLLIIIAGNAVGAVLMNFYKKYCFDAPAAKQ